MLPKGRGRGILGGVTHPEKFGQAPQLPSQIPRSLFSPGGSLPYLPYKGLTSPTCVIRELTCWAPARVRSSRAAMDDRGSRHL